MYYYQHHIGDFRAGCYNMTRMERALYREMLDIYYDTEQPLPDSEAEICKLLGVRGEDEKRMVGEILMLKFEQVQGRGWVHERCDAEIAKYHGNIELASKAGKASAAARAAKKASSVQQEPNDRSTDVQQESNGTSTNHKPITNNHKPKSRGTRLPDDWHPTVEDTAFCKQNRPDLKPSEVASRFYDHWIAQPGQKGTKVDWSATWRNWVRNEKPGQTNGHRPTGPQSDSDAWRGVL
jgi:uncharacterized protein YdaU (DUF1376 family)